MTFQLCVCHMKVLNDLKVLLLNEVTSTFMVLFIVIFEADSRRETRVFFRSSPFVLKTGVYDNTFFFIY